MRQGEPQIYGPKFKGVMIGKSQLKSPQQSPPRAIIDNFNVIGNPFKGNDIALHDDVLATAITAAPRDYQLICKFIYTYIGSTPTVNAYRRELERLAQWCWFVQQRSVVDLSREEIEDFVRFAIKPPIAWIGRKNVARFVTLDGERQPNPDWRPYVVSVSKSDAQDGKTPSKKLYAPSQASIQAIFSVLSSFYDYLVEEEIIDNNPVKAIRQKSKFLRKDHNRAIVRRISNLQWDYVIETVAQLADVDQSHERTLFIMNCLFAMYLRVSELVWDERSQPVMGDFRRDADGFWWFHVTGKGNKDRTISVSDEMLEALSRYRLVRGLSKLPALGEMSPLIPKNKGHGGLSSTRQIRRIVQSCFDAAFERMKDEGMLEDATELRTATVHWLRHTGISEDVKTRPREHVRDDAGHSTMATTDRYIESDRRERHLSGRKKPLKDL